MRTVFPRTPAMEVAVGLIAGILVYRQSLPLPLAVLAITASAVLIIVVSKLELALRAFLPICILLGYFAMYQSEAPLLQKDYIGNFSPLKGTRLTGTVTTPIEYFRHGFRFVLNATTLNGKPVSGLVRIGAYFDGKAPLPGDTVKLEDVYLKPVIGLKNFGGFNLERFLKDQGITVQTNLRKEKELVIASPAGPWEILPLCEKLRRNIHRFIENHYPPEDAGAVAAMTVGVTGGITKEQRRQYSASGLAHLLAVAGLHVGFISATVYCLSYAFFFHLLLVVKKEWLDAGKHRMLAAGFCMFGIFTYVLLAGAHIPARRAGVMAGVYFLAIICGKEGDLFNSLALSAIIILLIDPHSLFSASFVLSYTAVIAIALLYQREKSADSTVVNSDPEGKLEELMEIPAKAGPRFSRITGFFRETLKISLALGLATLPVVMYTFNEVSIGGFAANIVAVPLALFAIPSVFVSAGLSLIWGPLGDAGAWLSSLAFSGIQTTAKFFGSGTFSFSGPAPAFWLIGLFYAVYLMWAFRSRFFALSTAGLCLVTVVYYLPHKRSVTEIRFIDVGQGDSTLLLLKDGTNILIDGGVRFGQYDVGESEILPEMKRLGIRRLDAVIATHGDMDHVGGLFSVLRGIEVLRYMDNGEPHRMLDELRKLAASEHIPMFALHAGMEIPLSNAARLNVLHPSATFIDEHPGIKNNNISLMLLVETEGRKILLPADNEKTAERYLLKNGADLKADVLKVAHHGSASSTTPPFLDSVSPRVAVISVGKLNRYRMPAKKTLASLWRPPLAVYQTKDEGEVSITVRQGKIAVRTCLNPDFEEVF